MSTWPSGKLTFTKASACGNDFLIIDAERASGARAAEVRGAAPPDPQELGELARRLCDRHNGVGADGVEWLFPDSESDSWARLFNADGSEAEISGNGTRCVAAELWSRRPKPEIVIRTAAGLKTCRLIHQEATYFEFETDMGTPVVAEELAVEAAGQRTTGQKISTGNPHFVVFVDEFPADWQQRAALIGAQPLFPQGTNVEYVTVTGRNQLEIRLYERGVGETQSSGTGSCAAAVAAIASGRVASPVKVVAPGGTQAVRWQERVFLRGPATIICRGEFFV